MTASITNEAVDELGLKAGGQATAVIKASDVMVAIELARVDKQSKENRPAVNGVVLNHQLLACSLLPHREGAGRHHSTPVARARRRGAIPATYSVRDYPEAGGLISYGTSFALCVVANPLILSNIIRINILAAGARLPTSYIAREYVQGGGLLSYGPSFAHIYRRAGDFFDKILRGTNPGTIPVEQPTKFDLVINLIE